MGQHILVENVEGVVIATFADAEIIADEVMVEVARQLTELNGWLVGRDVLLNFRNVRFMSSTMLVKLLNFARQAQQLGTRVKVCCLAPALRDVFRITHFDRFLEVYAEESAALDSFAR